MDVTDKIFQGTFDFTLLRELKSLRLGPSSFKRLNSTGGGFFSPEEACNSNHCTQDCHVPEKVLIIYLKSAESLSMAGAKKRWLSTHPEVESKGIIVKGQHNEEGQKGTRNVGHKSTDIIHKIETFLSLYLSEAWLQLPSHDDPKHVGETANILLCGFTTISHSLFKNVGKLIEFSILPEHVVAPFFSTKVIITLKLLETAMKTGRSDSTFPKRSLVLPLCVWRSKKGYRIRPWVAKSTSLQHQRTRTVPWVYWRNYAKELLNNLKDQDESEERPKFTFWRNKRSDPNGTCPFRTKNWARLCWYSTQRPRYKWSMVSHGGRYTFWSVISLRSCLCKDAFFSQIW